VSEGRREGEGERHKKEDEDTVTHSSYRVTGRVIGGPSMSQIVTK
jgi:hypothetical protein